MLHRAFSVFLFNTQGELLLQQRAGVKITFPLRWTNTCCSHPLYNHAAPGTGEMSEVDGAGVKQAAIRKLEHELGIKGDLHESDLTYLTKIHYKANSDGTEWGQFSWDFVIQSRSKQCKQAHTLLLTTSISCVASIFFCCTGEHEIDWILFAIKDVKLDVNPNECEAVRWVSMPELKQLFNDAAQPESQIVLTPWFKMIAQRFLYDWWPKREEICKANGIGEAAKTKVHFLQL